MTETMDRSANPGPMVAVPAYYAQSDGHFNSFMTRQISRWPTWLAPLSILVCFTGGVAYTLALNPDRVRRVRIAHLHCQADDRLRLPRLRRHPRILVPAARQHSGRGAQSHHRGLRGPVPGLHVHLVGRQPHVPLAPAVPEHLATVRVDLPWRLAGLHDSAQPALGAVYLDVRVGLSRRRRPTSNPRGRRRQGAMPVGGPRVPRRCLRWPYGHAGSASARCRSAGSRRPAAGCACRRSPC